MKRKVLVVDDSGVVRKLLTEILNSDPELEVVAAARDPYEARELIKLHNPHVLTLDVEMPRMDGITFLQNLMRLRPMPVVMVSSLTAGGADATLAALQAGAVDFIAKPAVDVEAGLRAYAQELIEKVKAVSHSHVRSPTVSPAAVGAKVAALQTTDRVIALGGSTGGTEAISEFLVGLPPDMPGMVIAQHIPEVFSARFAARLEHETRLVVREARDGAPLLVGHVFVAPGGRHLRVQRSGLKYFCVVGDDAPVNRHRPSVDVLFDSVAQNVGRNAIGVLFTGMGADGAAGLLRMREAGAFTLAQDRETSVVWGMPGEAVKRGAAVEVLPLSQLAARAQAVLRGSGPRPGSA